MFLLYQIGIRLYYLIILLASPFSRKAGEWLSGRRKNQSLIRNWKVDPSRRTLWMHVSSLGEFEQGRPVLERWKSQFPAGRIVLSFFSPSGFNIRKNYPLADLVFYLPLDTQKNMDRLVDQLSPDLFILVKYDFWPNLLGVLNHRKIPSFLISGSFRPEQYLFRKWGRVFLGQLRDFKFIFVQDEASLQLLKDHRFNQVVLAGDTRVDAVMKKDIKRLRQEDIKTDSENGRLVIIGGSTWPKEERMLAGVWNSPDFREMKPSWRLVIAPHDIGEKHLKQIEGLFNGEITRLSRIGGTLTDAFDQHPVILVDSIGLLSSLYAFADIAFIGGGFGKGIHNILEPASYGIPVIFGPNRSKFREAERLITIGGAFTVKDFDSFRTILKKLSSDPEFRAESGNLAVSYMKSQVGSSDLIIRHLLGKW